MSDACSYMCDGWTSKRTRILARLLAGGSALLDWLQYHLHVVNSKSTVGLLPVYMAWILFKSTGKSQGCKRVHGVLVQGGPSLWSIFSGDATPWSVGPRAQVHTLSQGLLRLDWAICTKTNDCLSQWLNRMTTSIGSVSPFRRNSPILPTAVTDLASHVNSGM